MKLKFDPNQQYQLDAINAVVDIFRGQQNITNGVSIPGQLPLGIEGQQLSLETAGARGNNLLLSEDQVIRNTRLVQERNSILPAETAGRAIVTNHRSTDVVYGEKFLCGMNFSIEIKHIDIFKGFSGICRLMNIASFVKIVNFIKSFGFPLLDTFELRGLQNDINRVGDKIVELYQL